MKQVSGATVRRVVRNLLGGAEYAGLRAVSKILPGPLRGFRELQPNEVTWRANERFVATLDDGEVFSDYGVILNDRMLISDLSPMMGSRKIEEHEALCKYFLGHTTLVSGPVAVISSHAHQRYFHWMFDVLPRIEILRQSGLEFSRLVANTELGFQRETLAAVGGNDAISPQPHNRIRAKKLLVPSLPGILGVPSHFAIEFLRRSFGLEARPYRKLYVARGDALTRRVCNEAEVIEALPGFEVVLLDGMSVAGQARLFAEAALVVGPHGAGFTNAVFMKSGTRMIEFMPQTYFNNCFEAIALDIGIRYHRIECESFGAPNHDMLVNLSLIKKSLN